LPLKLLQNYFLLIEVDSLKDISKAKQVVTRLIITISILAFLQCGRLIVEFTASTRFHGFLVGSNEYYFAGYTINFIYLAQHCPFNSGVFNIVFFLEPKIKIFYKFA
jgi:hypothetical protein